MVPQFKELSRSDIATFLYRAARKFFIIRAKNRSTITFREVHLNDRLRADILNISWDEKIVIAEIKTCKADFRADDKWRGYLDYCDYFYFICPDGEIKKESLPEKIGLVYVKGDLKNPYFQVVKSPYKLNPKKLNGAWFKYLFKKLAFRKLASVKDGLIDFESEKLFENT